MIVTKSSDPWDTHGNTGKQWKQLIPENFFFLASTCELWYISAPIQINIMQKKKKDSVML